MLNNKRISRIIVSVFAAALSFTILTGCGSIGGNSVTKLSIDTLGPAGDDSRYVVRRIGDKDGYPYTGIARLDVNTGEDEVLFQVDNSASDRIMWPYVDGDHACFIVDAVKATPEYSAYFLNVYDGTCQKIFETDEDLSFAVIDGEMFLDEGKDNRYKVNMSTGELEMFPLEEGDIQVRSIYEEKTELKYKMTSGEKAVIKTTFGDPAITCSVEGKELSLDSISTDEYKYASMSREYMSDKDGLFYGVLTIPRKQLKERDMKVSPSSMSMSDVKKEVLYSVDTKTGENKVLYEGSERVIGYNEHYVYLLDGQKVKRLNMDTGKSSTLGRIKSYAHSLDIVVKWTDNTLVIYDLQTGEVLGCLR